MTFRDFGIDINELQDYVSNVDPVPFAHDVPQ